MRSMYLDSKAQAKRYYEQSNESTWSYSVVEVALPFFYKVIADTGGASNWVKLFFISFAIFALLYSGVVAP